MLYSAKTAVDKKKIQWTENNRKLKALHQGIFTAHSVKALAHE